MYMYLKDCLFKYDIKSQIFKARLISRFAWD